MTSVIAAITWSTVALAQSDAPTQETDPVFVFNNVCYTRVPVLDNIRSLATEFAWRRIEEGELKQFTIVENPKVLEGWDVKIGERLYRVGVVQNDVIGKFRENFPDFSNGTTTSCSLVLDGRDKADVVMERMNTLIKKEPASVDVADGSGLLTTTWAGGNKDFKVFVFYKTDTNEIANLINVTIISKERLH